MYNRVIKRADGSFARIVMTACLLVMFLISSFWTDGSSLAATAGKGSGVAAGASANDIEAPSAPDGLKAVNRTCTSIVLLWNESSDNVKVTGYQVYKDGRKIISTSRTVYTNTDLLPDKDYKYEIKAYDAAGNLSDASLPLVVRTVADLTAPSAPGSLMVSSRSWTSITLQWKPSSDNSGLKGYTVFCNGVKKASTTGTSYICKGFLPGKSYSFFVIASDKAGNYSAQSNTVSGATLDDLTAPTAPSGIKPGNISETEAELSWSPSSDNVRIKGYEIYLDGVKKSTTSKTSYKIKGLAPGKSYVFSIKAADIAGNLSGMSDQVRVTTKSDLQAPDAPAGLKVVLVDGSAVTLSWDESKDNVKVKGYRIYCNGLIIADTSRTTRSVRNPTGIPFGLYWIRAYDIVDNLSAPSNTVAVLSRK